MKSVYIIAEAGVNHNGDVNNAMRLIDAAKLAGADAVKFQTFKTRNIIVEGTDLAVYQKNNIRSEVSQFEMIHKLELSFSEFKLLHSYATKIGIDFLSTPDDFESLDFLVNELNLSKIKVGSAEVTNIPFLKAICATKKQVILSTGMCTLGEVERAVNVFRENSEKLTILHCTSNYPCPMKDVNLKSMRTLEKAFDLPVGYSDHTLGYEVSIAAVSLGAKIIEKHITLDKNMEGPDHGSSLDPVEFRQFVEKIRNTEEAMGFCTKRPTKGEEQIKPVVRKRIVAAHDLKAGTKLCLEDLNFKRANSGLFVESYKCIINSTLAHDLKKDSPIDLSIINISKGLENV